MYFGEEEDRHFTLSKPWLKDPEATMYALSRTLFPTARFVGATVLLLINLSASRAAQYLAMHGWSVRSDSQNWSTVAHRDALNI